MKTLGKIVLATSLGLAAFGGASVGNGLKNLAYEQDKYDSRIESRIDFGDKKDKELAKKELVILDERYKSGSMRDIGYKLGGGLFALLICAPIAGGVLIDSSEGSSGDNDDYNDANTDGKGMLTGIPH